MHKNKSGFTIVELLIVIVVIAILAAITIVSYNGIQERARVVRANSDLVTLQEAIQLARVYQSKTLSQITNSVCTCGNVAGTAAAIDAISAASGANLAGLKAGDPWGNIYYIDENEGEVAGACTKDVIQTNPSRSGVAAQQIPTYSC